MVICDHLVAPSLKTQGLGGEKYRLSVKDLHTGTIAVYPVTEKDAALLLSRFAILQEGGRYATFILTMRWSWQLRLGPLG